MSIFPAPWGNYALKELAETSQPAAISWWPQTLAWKIVLLLLIVYVIKKLHQKVQAYKRDAYRRDALSWIAKLPEYNSDLPAAEFRQLPALLRRTAILGFSRENVSMLANNHWEVWLDKQCQQCGFSQQYARLLHHLAYAPTIDITAQQMKELVAQITLWVKNHRRQND
jgi:hypothetical protein